MSATGAGAWHPALAFGIGEQDSLTLAYLHQQENECPDTGIPFVDGRPAPVPRDAFLVWPPTSDTTRRRHRSPRAIATSSADSVSLADTLRYANYGSVTTPTRRISATYAPNAATPLADILVGRDAPASSGVQTNLTEQIDLTAHFCDGRSSRTRWSTGLEIARQTSTSIGYVNPFNTRQRLDSRNAAAGSRSLTGAPGRTGGLATGYGGALGWRLRASIRCLSGNMSISPRLPLRPLLRRLQSA